MQQAADVPRWVGPLGGGNALITQGEAASAL